MIDHDELLGEATHIIDSLWNPSHTREVAEHGIITTLPDGEVAIVSSVDGTILWSGGAYLRLPWAVAFCTAARQVANSLPGT